MKTKKKTSRLAPQMASQISHVNQIISFKTQFSLNETKKISKMFSQNSESKTHMKEKEEKTK
jgi:hypothetical protein